MGFLILCLPLLAQAGVQGGAWEGLPTELRPALAELEHRAVTLPAVEQGADPAQLARQVHGGRDFVVSREQPRSLGSPRRVLLERLVDGVPVAFETTRVNWLADGRVLVVSDLSDQDFFSGALVLERQDAEGQARAAFDSRWKPEVLETRLEVLPLAAGARLAWRSDVTSPESDAVSYRVWVDAESGAILARHNTVVHQVTGIGATFDPNPIQTLDDPNLKDLNNSATSVPIEAYFVVDLLDLDGSGYLVGPWASTEVTNDRVNRPTFDYRASRAQPVFEEVVAYFHVDRFQRYLQSLGLNARQAKQRMDVHDKLFGFIEYPNASYNLSTKIMAFGTLGVDFAEDGDVVVHEYGHAIHDDVQGGIGLNTENGAMSEGVGDWLCAVNGDDSLVGEWVSSSLGLGGELPFIRRTDRAKVYPDDLTGAVHDDGEIWSGALWEIAHMVGYDVATTLVIEGMALQTSNTGMRQAAQFLLQADQQVYGGANRAYLTGPLQRAGLLVPGPSDIVLTANRRFLKTGDRVTFSLSAPSLAGSDFQVVLATQAVATATGPPFNTTLDIDTTFLPQSQGTPALSGTLDASGEASFAVPVAALEHKTRIFAQAMILSAAGASVGNSAPIAFRAERH